MAYAQARLREEKQAPRFARQEARYAYGALHERRRQRAARYAAAIRCESATLPCHYAAIRPASPPPRCEEMLISAHDIYAYGASACAREARMRREEKRLMLFLWRMRCLLIHVAATRYALLLCRLLTLQARVFTPMMRVIARDARLPSPEVSRSRVTRNVQRYPERKRGRM